MNNLSGIDASYAEDLLRAGKNEWKTHSDAILELFETTGNQQATFTFALIHITESGNMYHIDQNFNKSKIAQILSDAEFSKFASMRMKFDWLANIRPDIVFKSHKLMK